MNNYKEGIDFVVSTLSLLAIETPKRFFKFNKQI